MVGPDRRDLHDIYRGDHLCAAQTLDQDSLGILRPGYVDEIPGDTRAAAPPRPGIPSVKPENDDTGRRAFRRYHVDRAGAFPDAEQCDRYLASLSPGFRQISVYHT